MNFPSWYVLYSKKATMPNPFTSVSMSASGQFQTLVSIGYESGTVYVSNNYGQNWTLINVQLNLFNNKNYNIAISASGQYQSITCSNNSNTSSGVLQSSNYGVTWITNLIISDSTVSTVPNSISMSASGQYQTMISNFNIYISSNYGQTWITNSSSSPTTDANYAHISISASGQYQSIGSSNSINNDSTPYIYNSVDYGTTWTASYISSSMYNLGIKISSSGQYIYSLNVDPTGNISNLYLSNTALENNAPSNDIFSVFGVDLINYGSSWTQLQSLPLANPNITDCP